MTLILVGYMGSGKSSVGKKLSKVVNYNFIDFDTYIEEKVGMKVSDIFKTKGEIFFRKQEHLYLKEVITKRKAIVALGGGTPCYGNNLNIIKEAEHSKMIYLKSSISNLTERLFEEKSSRPLISHIDTKENLLEFIGKHVFERAPIYEQADIIIKTDALSLDKVVESVLLELF
ncbi:shikimate kinase [Psychroserpens jangbogonensis]|uniref:shikimate kinase n=1 Tax=Psychroserpens jangbogonensis TaxID=1484460 RepID=UPI00053E96B9|nr:shikimate kinase [Psychroserpens jangbogonensis]